MYEEKITILLSLPLFLKCTKCLNLEIAKMGKSPNKIVLFLFKIMCLEIDTILSVHPTMIFFTVTLVSVLLNSDDFICWLPGELR